MANPFWIGTSPTAVAQRDTLTPGGTIEANDKFLVTLTDEAGDTATLSVAAGGTTVAATVASIVAAFNASTDPRFTPITASDQTTHVRLLADTAGVPFFCTVSTTESDDSPGDTQTFVRAASIANSGPNDFNDPLNYSTGVKPVSTDTLTLDGRMQTAILYGLRQTAITLAKLKIERGSFDIGTINAALAISFTIGEINVAPTDGSNASGAAVVNLASGTNATTTDIYGSRNSGTSGKEPVMWGGTHASNIVRVHGAANVGIGTLKPGETGQLATLQVLDQAKVRAAAGITLATATQTGGSLVLECACTTINQDGGTLETKGTGAITTIYGQGAMKLNSTGTITTLNVEASGSADFTGNTAARTVSNAFCRSPNASVNAALPTVAGAAPAITFTNGVDCVSGGKSSKVDFGGDVTVNSAST